MIRRIYGSYSLNYGYGNGSRNGRDCIVGLVFGLVSIAAPTTAIIIGSVLALTAAAVIIEGLKPKPRNFDWMRRIVGWEV